MNLFKSKRPHFEYLRKKWKQREKNSTQNLFDKHIRKAAIGSLGGLMLLTTPGFGPDSHHILAGGDGAAITGSEDKSALLKAELLDKVPDDVRKLTPEEDKNISNVLTKNFDLDVEAEIDNKRLNRTYGLIGGEQHLYRFPGDNVYGHAKNAQDWAMFGPAGIAPGLGAWGYFAPSKQAFDNNPKAEEREKYYIAVQTFLSPGFAERTAEYRDFYKYRKMLVVNPKTGQAVVADIADAGPSEYTGKHLGGSPEVMHELGLASGPRKGAVLYYFIDDPNDSVPLGPIKPIDRNQLAKS